MLAKLNVRSKLIAILAAPLVVLVLLAGVGVVQRSRAAGESRQVGHLTELAAANVALTHQLQREQLLSAEYVATGGARRGPELAEERAATDRATVALEAALVELGHSVSRELGAAVEDVSEDFEAIAGYRSAVDAGQQGPAASLGHYASMTSTLLALNGLIVTEAGSPELSSALTTYVALSRAKELTAQEGGLLAAVFSGGQMTAPARAELDRIMAEQDDQYLIFDALARPDQRSFLRTKVAGEPVYRTADLREVALQTPEGPLTMPVDPATWSDAMLAKLDQLKAVEDTLAGGVLATAVDLQSAAEQDARLYLFGALVAVLVALLLAFVVARAITVPLRRLTQAARSLSREQLPSLVEGLKNPRQTDVGALAGGVTPIPVDTGDEIGQLASAFNDIQNVAVEVAAEQAQLLRKGIGDMFVNLARRNQTLLDRQIEFLDELEAGEQDPDQLEHLFKLDHLATRMRRNAESLLVLAGVEPSRRRALPVPLTDVVRAAIGEVEDFARIDLMALDEVAVAGTAAVDVAHLLSELMENATQFSPPEARVELVGHQVQDCYVISVTDQGIGMTPEQLAEANDLLARPPLVGLDLSRSLGFIVIGRLAARAGITVRLTPSPSAGLSAVVTLPPHLLTDTMEGDGDALEEEEEEAGDDLMAPAEAAGPRSSAADAAPVPVGLADWEAENLHVPTAAAAVEPEPTGLAAWEAALLDAAAAPQPVVDPAAANGQVTEPVVEWPDVDPEPQPLEADGSPTLGEPMPDPDFWSHSAPDDNPWWSVVGRTHPAGLGDRGDAGDPLAAAPPTLREAVPEGQAFDDGLAALIREAEGGSADHLGADHLVEPEVAVPAADEPATGSEPTGGVGAPGAIVDDQAAAEGVTAAGLTRRVPRAHLDADAAQGSAVAATRRSPEEVRRMLARYRSGLDRGRAGEGGDQPETDPFDHPSPDAEDSR